MVKRLNHGNIDLDSEISEKAQKQNNENILKYINNEKLWTFNAETENFNKKETIGVQYLRYGGSICFLPDGRIFYYDSCISIIIVDPSNPSNSKKRLPTLHLRGTWDTNPCSIYKDGDIYLFGVSYETSSAKFNITKNKWFEIPKFSWSWMGSYSPFIFKDYILRWTWELNLLCYDTIINSFSEFSYPDARKGRKICFVVNETLYIIDYKNKKCVMTDNLIIWNEIEDRSLSENLYSIYPYSPIFYNQKYYYLGLSAIFAFDLKTKENREVCKIPN